MASDLDGRTADDAVYGLLSPYDALVCWRSRQQDAGRPGIEALRPEYLMQIATGDLSSADAVKRRLPGSLNPLADEIATVVTKAWAARRARVAGPTGSPDSTHHHNGAGLHRVIVATTPAVTRAPNGAIALAPPERDSIALAATGGDSIDRGAIRQVESTAPVTVSGLTVGVAFANPTPADSSNRGRIDPADPDRQGGSTDPAIPAQGGSPSRTAAVERIDPSAFAPMSFTEPTGDPAQLRSDPGAGGVAMSWGVFDTDQPVVVYRVVSRDDGPPWSPDDADLVAITMQTECVDQRAPEGAVRHLQVWANAGRSIEQAVRAQPRLVAACAVVSPVIGPDIREEEGRVIGQWAVWEGTSAVQVLRIPLSKAAQLGGNPQYRILESRPNLGGFVDNAAERGRAFLYQVYAEAVVDDVIKLSVPVNRRIAVSAALERVPDLTVDLHGTGQDRTFDVSWTAPPAGKVVIFRSEQGPRPGAEVGVLAESALAQTGLQDVDRLAHPVDMAGAGRVGMAQVPWPRSWNRAFFTPVTVLEGRAVLGTTVAATRTDSISDAKIVERVDRQIVTFTWPAGASSVLMFIGPIGALAESAMTGNSIEITRNEWDRLGGIQLRQSLPSRGCSVHLLPIAFDSGRRIQGAPCTIEYSYLVRIYYRVDVRRNLLRRPVAAFVSLFSADDPIAVPTSYVLVHHPSRLPLDITDGVPLPLSLDGEPGAQLTHRITLPHLGTAPDGYRWRADLAKLGGFVRLFIDVDTPELAHWALIDPPVGELILGTVVDGR